MADEINLDDEAEDWLVTYADAITLLMAFFIMLVSFSKIDLPTYEQVAAGIRNEIGGHKAEPPTETLKKDVQNVVYDMQASDLVSITSDDRGLVIEMPSHAFFKPGTADIRADAVPFLVSLAEALINPRYKGYLMEAEGHTDDIPINTDKFPSNWELSTARAATLVRFLVTQDFEADRLKASGYADTRPKAPNRDADGNPITDNQEQNRRVLVRIYPMSLEDRKRRQKGVALEELDEAVDEAASDAKPADAPAPATATETPGDGAATEQPAAGDAPVLPALPPMVGGPAPSNTGSETQPEPADGTLPPHPTLSFPK